MTFQILELALKQIFDYPLLGQEVEIAWHAGEPLVVPVSWYQHAVERIEALRPAYLQPKHTFQTNGLLLNSKWIRFFIQLKARVGLSIDGPAELHDLNRRKRDRRGTHRDVMRAARLLQDHGLDFHVITVLTERTLDAPEKLFDFYVRNGIKEVGFNVEEVEGQNGRSSLLGEHIEAKFRRFIRSFFALTWESHGLLQVREFENVLGRLLLNEPVTDQQNTPFAIVSIGYDGAISTFSPELLGAHHPRFGTFGFGNVTTDLLRAIQHSSKFQAINEEIQCGVRACERNCSHFRWCGGGAPANKVFETGRFDTTETMYCRLTRKAILDEILAEVEMRIGKPTKECGLLYASAPPTDQLSEVCHE